MLTLRPKGGRGLAPFRGAWKVFWGFGVFGGLLKVGWRGKQGLSLGQGGWGGGGGVVKMSSLLHVYPQIIEDKNSGPEVEHQLHPFPHVLADTHVWTVHLQWDDTQDFPFRGRLHA